jgi:hypothetical protein
MTAAMHEICHASYAMAVGLRVEYVRLSPPESSIHWGVSPVAVARVWQDDPTQALYDCLNVCGMLLAPSVVTGTRVTETEDWSQLCAMQRAWQALPATADEERPLPWADVLRLAGKDVAAWSTRPGASGALDFLAVQLSSARFLSGQRWRTLWQDKRCTPLWSAVPD